LDGPLERIRALDGDTTVFMELLPPEEDVKEETQQASTGTHNHSEPTAVTDPGNHVKEEWWQNDEHQVQLWNLVVPL
jgi:hypothetical protein